MDVLAQRAHQNEDDHGAHQHDDEQRVGDAEPMHFGAHVALQVHIPAGRPLGVRLLKVHVVREDH
eukprot:2141372-Prorocentrum_lima.AAC.1